MQHRDTWKRILMLGSLGFCLGAAPAAPSHYGVERSIDEIRNAWARPGANAQPNAPGWNAFFDALRREFQAYDAAPSENDRLVSLNRLYQMSVALRGIAWPPAVRVREELRAWLRPRVRLAWAERSLIDSVRRLGVTPYAAVQGNRQRWLQ